MAATSIMPTGDAATALLGPGDPGPVEVINPDGFSDIVLVCEHAGRAIPACLGDLGIPSTEMDRHIAYDVGAEGLARKTSALLDAPLVLQRYSRLVIDCNRPLTARDSVPETSDGTAIPANRNLSAAHRNLRADAIHRPFHDTIAELLDLRGSSRRRSVLATIHSFVPRFAGRDRPWLLGICFNRDGIFAKELMKVFQATNPNIIAAHNEPYCVDDESDYAIPVHGERRGLPHVLIEVRHDQIAEDSGQVHWAALLAHALNQAASARASMEPTRVA